jgi:PAS domain S-box-containing protein
MSVSTKKPVAETAMPSPRIRGAAYRYGLAIVSFAFSLGVGLLARRYGIGHQFAMLLFGIAFAGWNCGLGPAVVAAVFSSLAYDYFITPPVYEIGFNRYDLIDFALFSSFAFLITRFREVRWRTEHKLRESEERYRTLVQHAPEAIVVLDVDTGRFVDANKNAVRLFGRSKEALLEVGPVALSPPTQPDGRPSSESASENIQKAVEGAEVVFEWTHFDAAGKEIPCEVRLVRLLAGESVLVRGSIIDITERERARQALKERADLLDLTHDTVFVRTMSNVITYWNRGAQELYGWSNEEAIGQPSHELLRTEFREPLEQISGKLLQADRWEGELIHTARDGKRFVVSSRWSLQRDERGEPLAILETNTDITERKRAEQELRSQAELIRLAHDAIIVRDPESRVTFWNAGAEKTYGWTAGEAIGRVTHDLLQTRFPVSREVIDLALEESGEWEGELTHVTQDGTSIVVTSRQSLRRDKHGAPAAVLEINRDVTEHKRAEEEIRKLNEALEQRVIERTQELQTVNKELEAFAYSVSHDLRAPVRHIAGFAELLRKHADRVLDDEGRHRIEMILDSANRMGTLVDGLLAFSRIGRSETQKTTVRLTELMQTLVREIAPDTQHRRITWRIGNLPTCHGDPTMLRVVFGNLISNAVKFTRTCEEAEIEIGSLNHTTDEMLVFIKDNGVGFNMKYKDKLFGVFQRLHSQEAFEGTGIGLATVQRIVHRHGGRVWAEGSVNNGATFYVALPSPGKMQA